MPHTPGPWKMKVGTIQNADRGFSVYVGPEHAATDILSVGAAGGPPMMRQEDEANARLIAAAPDLYAACVEALRILAVCRDDLAAAGNGGDDAVADICEEAQSLTPAIKQLRAAIAKAEGR